MKSESPRRKWTELTQARLKHKLTGLNPKIKYHSLPKTLHIVEAVMNEVEYQAWNVFHLKKQLGNVILTDRLWSKIKASPICNLEKNVSASQSKGIVRINSKSPEKVKLSAKKVWSQELKNKNITNEKKPKDVKLQKQTQNRGRLQQDELNKNKFQRFLTCKNKNNKTREPKINNRSSDVITKFHSNINTASSKLIAK